MEPGTPTMKVEVFEDAETVAHHAAHFIAAAAREAVSVRGQFILGVSGGRTPWKMLEALTATDMPWEDLFITQVDERVISKGHAERNLTHLLQSVSSQPRLRLGQVYPMPVEADNLMEAAEQYALTIQEFAGKPPMLDVVHLGLGPDGHTASLVPDAPVLSVMDADVAITEKYQGRQRMTLTYPMLNRARRILWMVTGADKAEMLVRLLEGDVTIPAGRVNSQRAIVFADRLAAEKLKRVEHRQ